MATRPVAGGTIIGYPGQGTHSYTAPPNNWQSDRALDFGVPYGSPVYAASSGVIGPRFGSLDPPGSGSRFEGLRLTLESGWDDFWYGHLSKYARGIGPGVSVQEGQLLGWSGRASGVDHLHFAQHYGDVTDFLNADPGSGGGQAPDDPTPRPKVTIEGPAGNTIEAVPGPGDQPGEQSIFGTIGGIGDAIRFLFSIRFVELVGGAMLLLMGLYLLAKQAGNNTMVVRLQPVAGAASRVAGIGR